MPSSETKNRGRVRLSQKLRDIVDAIYDEQRLRPRASKPGRIKGDVAN